VHGETGAMTVRAAAGAWVVPPGSAARVPPGATPAVRAAGAVAARTLYLRPESGGAPAGRRRVLLLPGPVRGPIGRLGRLPAGDGGDGPEARLVAVLADELGGLLPAPLDLPLPRDRRAAAVAEALIAEPADGRDLEAWGQLIG